ncbi:histidine phosphatase family protein [Arthrospira platensis BEA 1257B]
MNQTLWIARHGDRQDHADSNWYRSSSNPFDPPLSAKGEKQAIALVQRLGGEKINYIFASPFLRTVATAHAVAEVLDLPVQLEPGLGEFLSGYSFPYLPKMRSSSELKADFPRINLNYESPQGWQYPETWSMAQQRMTSTIQRLTTQYPENLVLVGHAASVKGLTQALITRKQKLKTSLCCLVKLVADDHGWNLELAGDTSHLELAGVASQSHLLRAALRYYRYYRYAYRYQPELPR